MDECIAPGTVSEEDLTDYLLHPERVRPSLARHVAACAACSDEIESIRALEPFLRFQLYRRACPSVEELDAYVAGEISGEEALQVDAHVHGCMHCDQEIKALKHALKAAEQPAEGKTEPSSVDWDHLISEFSPEPLKELTASRAERELQAAVRGEAEGFLVVTAGKLTLELRLTFREAGEVELGGRIENHPSGATSALVRMVALGTVSDASLPPPQEVDKYGKFTFASVPYGTYRIEVVESGQVFVGDAPLVLHPPREDGES